MPNLGPTELIIIVLLFFVFIAPIILFLLKLQRVFEQCAVESRTMKPGHVWLTLIPLFGLVWQFIVVSRIASSLENEYRRFSTPIDPNPGKNIGIASGVLNICSVVPGIGTIAFLVGLICWIMYWVKISKYSKELALAQNSATAQQV